MSVTITDKQGTVTLSNGIKMPYLGLGVWQSKEGTEAENAVKEAIKVGYRHIDTASIYKNEESVGKGIKNSGVSRDQIFLTSKVWNTDQGYDTTKQAYEDSLKRLGTDYLDLYLVHWPVKGKFADTWRALEDLYEEGRMKAIGVSNFMEHHLKDLAKTSRIMPMVNQMEFHPHLVQQSLLDYCQQHQIQYEAWSPIMQGKAVDVPLLNELGKKYGKSPVQIVLRWDLQKGVVTIPKSSNPKRIQENAELFDFALTADELDQIDALDKNERVGPDPDNFNF